MPDDGFAFTGNSYDNTGALSANTWRHVAFIEQDRAAARPEPPGRRRRRAAALADVLGRLQALHPRGLPRRLPDRRALPHASSARSSCSRTSATAAATACRPARSASSTGARSRARRAKGRAEVHALLRPAEGRLEPACAKACPTESIQFGALDELRERAASRLDEGARRRASPARSSTAPTPSDGVGGFGAFFLLLDEPGGLRAAARPGRDDPRPARDLAQRRAAPLPARWPVAIGRAGAERRRWPSATNERARRPAPTTAGRSSRRRSGSRGSRAYFFSGGLAGASSLLALAARARRQRARSRATPSVARPAGSPSSPPLLIADLGRPDALPQHAPGRSRSTSPMSVGTWILTVRAARPHRDRGLRRCSASPPRVALAPRSGASACSARRSPPTRPCSSPTPPSRSGTRRAASCRSCSPAAPRRAPAPRRRSPRPPPTRRAARRLAGIGAVTELAALDAAMERRLGELGEPVPRGPGRALRQGCEGAHGDRRPAHCLRGTPPEATGASRRRPRHGGGAVLAARRARGRPQSAEDPSFTVEPQRRRAEAAGRRVAV